MTNLAGHDIEAVVEAFEAAAGSDEPTCFIAYTIKATGCLSPVTRTTTRA